MCQSDSGEDTNIGCVGPIPHLERLPIRDTNDFSPTIHLQFIGVAWAGSSSILHTVGLPYEVATLKITCTTNRKGTNQKQSHTHTQTASTTVPVPPCSLQASVQ